MKLFFSIIIFIFSTNLLAENILNRGNGSEPDSLNIHLAEGLNSHNVLRDLYEGLMTLDINGQSTYGAAISHRVENNLWTFKLRENARWSDGSLVVAGDFVRGWRQAINPKTVAPYAFLFHNIANAKKITQAKLPPDQLGIKAIDNHTLQVQLVQQDSAFLEKLSLPVFYPVAENKAANHEIISNGPYRLHIWNIQEKISLKKNQHYFAKNTLYFNQVNYWVTEDQSSELKRFRAGELDITESIPDSQIAWIKQNLAKELRISPYLGSFFLGLNISDKHLNNRQLRQALSLAINRTILTEKVLKTGQKPAYHIVPRSLTNNNSLQAAKFDGSLALKYLQQSGLDVEGLKIEILYNNSENQRKVAIAIAAMWRQTLGIKAQLLNQEWKVFVQSRKSSERQSFRSGWIADYADALSFLELFTSESRFNFYHYTNTNYDAIIEEIRASKDSITKNQWIEKAENILTHDMPVIPLYYYVSRHLVNIHILGYTDNIADRHLSKYLYKEE